MKLRALALAATVGVAATLGVGCSSNNGADQGSSSTTETPSTTEQTAPAETPVATGDPVTLTVWESTGGPDEFIQQAGEAFTALNPNVTIEYVNVELGDTTTQIALDGPAGVGPDVFVAPHDKLGELVAGGHVLPTVDAATLAAQVLGACESAVTYDGTMYGYPVSAETYGLFYNRDLIAEEDVPTSWEDLMAFAEEFNANNTNKYGFMMNTGDAYYTIIFTTADDNRLFGPSGTDITSSNINSAASVKGMEFFQSLRSILDVPAADLTTAVCDGAFANGDVALYITGPWNVAPFEEAGLDFGVAPLPALPGDSTPSASFSGTRSMFVSAYTDYPAEAAAFATFLLSDEMQKLRFDLTGTIPSIDIPVESPYIQGFLTQLDYAFPMPSIPQMNAYWDAMNAASANIWDGANVQSELDACNATILAQ